MVNFQNIPANMYKKFFASKREALSIIRSNNISGRSFKSLTDVVSTIRKNEKKRESGKFSMDDINKLTEILEKKEKNMDAEMKKIISKYYELEPPKTMYKNKKGGVQSFSRRVGTKQTVGNDVNKDFIKYASKLTPKITMIMRDALKDWQYKVVLTLSVNLRKFNVKQNATRSKEMQNPAFHSSSEDAPRTILKASDIKESIQHMLNNVENQMDNFIRNGSGHIVDSFNFIDVRIIQYKPIRGSSYIPLPAWVNSKKAVINVKNSDDKCFLWSVLSALHEQRKNAERVSKYKQYENTLNVSRLKFPVKVEDIPKFEADNNIKISVLFMDKGAKSAKDVKPLYNSKFRDARQPITLLRYDDDGKSHFVWVKSLNRLIGNSNNSSRQFFCHNCLNCFTNPVLLKQHQELGCFDTSAVKLTMPKEGENFVKFKSIHKQLEVPFCIYADMESMLVKPKDAVLEDTHLQEHIATSVGCIVTSKYEGYGREYVQFDGHDCIDKFVKYLLNIEDSMIEILRTNKPMEELTTAEKKKHRDAQTCYLCNQPFGKDTLEKVRDHDHITGKFRGSAHSSCNLQLNHKMGKRTNRNRCKIPIIFHNAKGYDSHLFLTTASKYLEDVEVVAQNTEKYISFSFRSYKVLDSLQFVNTSLESIVSVLNKANDESLFKHFNTAFKNANPELKTLLRQKGVYPYDFIDSEEKFKLAELPDVSAFFSRLSGNDVKPADYVRAHEVWISANCKTFKDYHDLYLKTDVVLLADAFENFRNTCMKYYSLDPCHYFTSPALSWDAMLKMSNIKIETFTDVDMLLFVEKGMRGGISMITHRYAKANNKYMKEFRGDLPSWFIVYLDANNLYGLAMSQNLPYADYKWNNDDWTEKDIMKIGEDASTGYIFEVDLEYPQSLHDAHNDYPLAPENNVKGVASKYIKSRMEELNLKTVSVGKLIPNLNNKVRYITHYRNLQFYIEQGLILTKVHRVLQFSQSRWLKKYIDFNTDQRAQTKFDHEKDFFKLMNNCIYGKTCENLRNRRDIKLVTMNSCEDKLNKLTRKPTFKNHEIINESLITVEMTKKEIVYDKPVIVGFCVLELSKVHMYDFHYNTIKKQYGEKAKLLFTDTDSLTYHIQTDDVYADMKEQTEKYDFSDYPKGHFCHSDVNKKVIGKFKDETASKPIVEFCGLRSKMYSIKLEDYEKKTAKGIARETVKRDITHENYKRALFGSTQDMRQSCTFNTIRSKKHILHTLKINKVGLCSFDDKRVVLENNIDTLALGHYNMAKHL